MADSVIQATGLGRRFGRIWALRDIDLDIEPGTLMGVVGPDGAGKTTLLQLLAAILDPNEGHCRTLGYDTQYESAAVTSRIGYMAQGFTLYERLSVSENLEFAATIRDVSKAEYHTRQHQLLTMANLGSFLDRAAGRLSGGMQKKLALCANLIHKPPLLLLDEPGLGVDPLSRRELWRILQEFRNTGTTIVLTTSYMEEAMRCDRILFMDKGRVLASGEPEGFLREHAPIVLELATQQPQTAAAALENLPQLLALQWQSGGLRLIFRAVAENTETLRGQLEPFGKVSDAKPGLEDVFVSLRSEEAEAGMPADKKNQFRDRAIDLAATEPATGGDAIRTVQLTKRFGDFTAVNEFTLNVKQGEILGLVGANGAGKTTLIRMLCGLIEASSGEAKVADIDVARSPRALRPLIGYMSQHFSLYPDLTVGENLAFYASTYSLSGAKGRAAIAWVWDVTELAGTDDKLVASLSGATRQRLALACAIVHKPRVVFLDEPTSGVDPLSRYRFWRLIHELSDSGTAVIVTTHYLEETVYCDRIAFMHEGRLIALGDIKSLKREDPYQIGDTLEDMFINYIEYENHRATGTV